LTFGKYGKIKHENDEKEYFLSAGLEGI